MEFMGSYKNKEMGLGGLGDCGALFFLALPSESPRSTCDVADAWLLRARDALARPVARPGRLGRHQRLHAAVPGEAAGGCGGRMRRSASQGPGRQRATGCAFPSAALPAPRLRPDAWRPSASLPRQVASSFSAFSSSSSSPASSVLEGKATASFWAPHPGVVNSVSSLRPPPHSPRPTTPSSSSGLGPVQVNSTSPIASPDRR